MTKILHIIGQQGSGKTQLALQIIAGLKSQGKTARLPQDEDYLTEREVKQHAIARTCRRAPFSSVTTPPDVLILEHQSRPSWLADVLQRGDQVITIEGGAA